MLERLTRNFRLLLSAFEHGVCPLCAVRTTLETPEVERVPSRREPDTVLTMPTPALAFRFAREFRRLVEKPRHLRPVRFGNREPYLREYDLLAVEVGQRRLGRPELAQRVGKPYPSEDPRTALERDGSIGEQLVEFVDSLAR